MFSVMFKIYPLVIDIFYRRIINKTLAEIKGVSFNENRTQNFQITYASAEPNMTIVFGYFSKEKYSKMKAKLYDQNVSVSSKIEMMERESVFPLCECALANYHSVDCNLSFSKKGKLVLITNNGKKATYVLYSYDFYLKTDDDLVYVFSLYFYFIPVIIITLYCDHRFCPIEEESDSETSNKSDKEILITDNEMESQDLIDQQQEIDCLVIEDQSSFQ